MSSQALSQPPHASRRPIGERVTRALFTPVDASGLAYFRVAFYAIMVWQVWEFIDGRWVSLYYSNKALYFTYWPFDFVRPWPAAGMGVHLYVMLAAAACALVGLCYRLSALLFFLLFTYTFLLEQSLYLNHWYLACLLSFLMIWIPAERVWSLDAWRRSQPRATTVPAWSMWLLRFQIGVPYFFGGVAKLNPDWLRGEPLRAWLAARTDFPLVGPLFSHEPVVWFMSYAGLLLDLFGVFFLLNRRTRVYTFAAMLLFHFVNARLFGIGIFPWTMIATTLVFFEPDWPRRVLGDLRRGRRETWRLAVGGLIGFVLGGFLPWTFSWVKAGVGALGTAVAAYHLDEPFRTPGRARTGLRASSRAPRWVLATLAVWMTVQVLVPLRHFLIAGNVHWTEEGHLFAWHMKLRHKDAQGAFTVTDPASGREWKLQLRDYVTYRQQTRMLSRPQLIVQFVRHVRGRLREQGYRDVEIRGQIYASLNGRAPQLLLDPTLDLTRVAFPWWGHASWIRPLHTPLATAWR